MVEIIEVFRLVRGAISAFYDNRVPSYDFEFPCFFWGGDLLGCLRLLFRGLFWLCFTFLCFSGQFSDLRQGFSGRFPLLLDFSVMSGRFRTDFVSFKDIEPPSSGGSEISVFHAGVDRSIERQSVVVSEEIPGSEISLQHLASVEVDLIALGIDIGEYDPQSIPMSAVSFGRKLLDDEDHPVEIVS